MRFLIITSFLFQLSISSASTAEYNLKTCPVATKTSPSDSVCKRDGGKFFDKHTNFLSIAKKNKIGVLFIGDSITEGWTYRAVSGIVTYNREFKKYNPANFGISGDKTENVIWRLTDGGELTPLAKKPPGAVVVMIGTNNIHANTAEEITAAIKKIVKTIREKLPTTKILLIGILPRANVADITTPEVINKKIDQINNALAFLDEKSALGEQRAMVRFLNVKQHTPNFNLKTFDTKYLYNCRIDKMLTEAQKKSCGDYGLHLNPAGYEMWAELIKPYLVKLIPADNK